MPGVWPKKDKKKKKKVPLWCSRLRSGVVTAMAWVAAMEEVQTLAKELPYAIYCGCAKKKKKERKKEMNDRKIAAECVAIFHSIYSQSANLKKGLKSSCCDSVVNESD